MVEASLTASRQKSVCSFRTGFKKQGWEAGLTWVTWAIGLTLIWGCSVFLQLDMCLHHSKRRKTKAIHQVYTILIHRIYRYQFSCMWSSFGLLSLAQDWLLFGFSISFYYLGLSPTEVAYQPTYRSCHSHNPCTWMSTMDTQRALLYSGLVLTLWRIP